MIQFFDTLSGKLKPFDLPAGSEVKMYTCGPTVYDYAHIGNFRTFVFEDLLRRFLEFKGYKVKHVMNITDVDDKTIAGANREGKKLEDFTKTYLDAFHEDLKTLNILPPTVEPRATHEIKSMLDLIQKLVEKKAAYVADGSVYYRVDTFKNYGKLSKKNLEKNIKGARVSLDEYDKEEGADFVLWKKSKEGEPSWDSPWGKGRPGWHIECSAMSMKYLGETFDIHAGGEDLIFPHHENEIAQSEAATGKPFVKYWLHSKHLLVDGKKMSKSAGNFYTLRDLLKGNDSRAIRHALLSVNYRTSLNFTFERLSESKQIIDRLDTCYRHCLNYDVKSKKQNTYGYDLVSFITDGMEMIQKALSNDLNVATALADTLDIVSQINFDLSKNIIDDNGLKIVLKFFENIDLLFGFGITSEETIPPEVLRLHEQRVAIRRDAKFARDQNLQKFSDDLRTKIEELGWIIKDGRPNEPSIIKKKRGTLNFK